MPPALLLAEPLSPEDTLGFWCVAEHDCCVIDGQVLLPALGLNVSGLVSGGCCYQRRSVAAFTLGGPITATDVDELGVCEDGAHSAALRCRCENVVPSHGIAIVQWCWITDQWCRNGNRHGRTPQECKRVFHGAGCNAGAAVGERSMSASAGNSLCSIMS